MKEEGFTIIELVISIFILAIAVVGIFAAFSIMVIFTSDSADRLTAAYLAQEGMEIVRNIRDTNWLNIDAGSPPDATWLDGLSSGPDVVNNSVDCSQGCEGDYTALATLSRWAGNGSYLMKSNTSGFYIYNTENSSQTKFKRKITITSLADYAIFIKVEVSWDEKATIISSSHLAGECGLSNCVTVEGTLYNWY